MTGVKPGDRIRLVSMGWDPDPIPPGSEGTVERVNEGPGFVQISVKWDNGRGLMLCPPDDRYVVIPGAPPVIEPCGYCEVGTGEPCKPWCPEVAGKEART